MVKLKTQLENPSLLMHKKEPGSKRLKAKSLIRNSIQGKDTQEVFEMTKDHQKRPLFKIIKAAENINRHMKKGSTFLLKLLERLNLDRPLILKEKLEIIWN